MTQFFKYLTIAGASTLLLLFSSCSKKQERHEAIETSLSVQNHAGSRHNISADEQSFFLRLSAPKAWTLSLKGDASSWLSLDVQQGEASPSYSVIVKVKQNTSKSERVALITLHSGAEDKTLTLVQSAEGVSTSSNSGLTSSQVADAQRIEIPALRNTKQDLFIVHRTQDGTVNYSLEYSLERYHPRWVAFVFDNTTAAERWKTRTNAWRWDPQVPSQYSTVDFFRNSGYSRGHMVASSDRYYSKDANEQTFYYTNMSPQRQEHNGGVWARLEDMVQKWGRRASFRETLYVVKGGTIDDAQIEPRRLGGKMVIPKYYYMALVVKKPNGEYHGLAFWTEHRNYAQTFPLRSLTISIDELERRTGIDFFPNLADDIEMQVEAELPENNWSGI